MLAVIIKQIFNRKKSNFWIALELLLVFCIVWFIVDYFFVLSCNRSIPSQRDTSNTYLMNISVWPETHAEYLTGEDLPENRIDNFNRIIDRLQHHPDVETVGVSFNRSYPGSDSFSNNRLENLEDSSVAIHPSILMIAMSGDYLKTFRHIKKEEKKVFSIYDTDLTDDKGIVITKMVEDKLFPGQSAVGKYVTHNRHDPEQTYVVKAVVEDIKRDRSERALPTIFKFQRIDEKNVANTDVSVRLNKKLSAVELAAFKQDLFRELRGGNYYLKDVVSYDKIMEDFDFNLGSLNTNRVFAALMIFFLLNIFLCVMGTFWYRVNSRKEEIGVRRAMGATKEKIHQLFMAEGLFILTLIFIPALLIELQFVYADLIPTLGFTEDTKGLYLSDRMALRFIISNVLTWLLLAAVMLLSIWYPARKAGKITPVEALRDE